MKSVTVKQPKRRRGKLMTVWLTEELAALLDERAGQLGLDRSGVIRGAIWVVALNSNLAFAAKSLASAGVATSPYPFGSHPNFSRRWSPSVANIASPSGTLFVRPLSLHYSIAAGNAGAIPLSYWILSDVGGCNTLPKTTPCQRLQRPHWLADSTPLQSVTQAAKNLLFLGRIYNTRPGQKPPLLTHPITYPSGVGIPNFRVVSEGSLRGYNLESCNVWVDRGDTIAVLIKHGEVLIDAADAWVLKYKLTGLQHGKTTYITLRRDGKTVLLHRVILGCKAGDEVDHDNRDGRDNRRINIALTTRHSNTLNRGMFATNTSGFRGVTRNQGQWLAKIGHLGKHYYIGRFDTPEEAARAWDKKALELRGDEAQLNFPDPSCRFSKPIGTSQNAITSCHSNTFALSTLAKYHEQLPTTGVADTRSINRASGAH